MRRLGILVTTEELEGVRTEQRCSGMFLSGGIPMGDPAKAVARLVEKYSLPADTGMDLSTGEFVAKD